MSALLDSLARERWFRSKARARVGGEVIEALRVGDVTLQFVRVRYEEGDDEVYVLGSPPEALGDALMNAIRDGAPEPLRAHRTDVDLNGLPPARLASAEQSNSAYFFGERVILKLYRRIVEGENPEVEILRFLASHKSVPTPQLAGELEYRGAALAMAQTFVASRGDAWGTTLAALKELDMPTEVDRAVRLGKATAELHRALASGTEPAFAPEPFDAAPVVARARENLQRLAPRLQSHPDGARLLPRVPALDERLSRAARRFETPKIRVHGDYHLGQVLVTPDDEFVIIDFEGEPARTLEERRSKSMPLRDVAGMLRSYDYAAVTAGLTEPTWKRAVSAAFVDAWRAGVAGSAAAPASDEEARVLLDLYLIDKGIYEVAYELDNRPTWVSIPVDGLFSLLEE